jgi:hypothetical protein
MTIRDEINEAFFAKCLKDRCVWLRQCLPENTSLGDELEDLEVGRKIVRRNRTIFHGGGFKGFRASRQRYHFLQAVPLHLH